ncbi:SbcC/MukB-like Walker B domain-containing protein [Actinocrispum wychmicini]|uniref:SbcC/MukB-like Walker B domain-containing protein n=1 Tax=Actinocrispum wychmicini TaxID=1213861 RepID=UPI001A9EC39C|nr:SbcC/MukB-like Walker B domain-containing protein [Actinocrispum wychmicini]
MDDELITEAARSFDDMEAVQRTLEGLVRADNAASAFLASYTTYLRTHARAAADVVARRRSDVEQARVGLAEVLSTRAAAIAAQDSAAAAVTETEAALGKLRAALESHQDSPAYRQHKGDLERLSDLVGKLAVAARQQREAANRAAMTAAQRETELRNARERLASARHAITRAAAVVAEDAEDAGIVWSAADAEPDIAFGDRVSARVTGRAEDVQMVRAAMENLRRANDERTRCDEALGDAEQGVLAAEATERDAAEHLTCARADTREALAGWDSRHARTLADLGVVACLESLVTVLDLVGEPDAATLESTFDGLTSAGVQANQAELHRLSVKLDKARADLDSLRQQRDRIAREHDDAPEPFGARTASRADRAGAPLWRLVRFADGLPAERAAAVEAALAAANVLDAWVDVDDDATKTAVATGRSDGYLMPLTEARRPSGPTLADVLVPESGAGVDTGRVRAILASIAMVEDVPTGGGAPAVSLGGAFAQGVQVGAHTKADAEFVGVTARRRRRELRLAELDDQIAEGVLVADELAGAIGRIEALLGDLAAARGELPKTGPIAVAVRKQTEAVGELRAHRATRDAASGKLDRAVAEAGDRQRRLTRTAADHRVSPDTVDSVAAAVDRFSRSAVALTTARGVEKDCVEAVAGAERRLVDARTEAAELAEKATGAEQVHAEQEEGLATLRASVGDDVEKVLRDIESVKERIVATDAELRRRRGTKSAADTAAGEARSAVTGAHTALGSAIAEAQADAGRLAPYAHREILDLLRVPAGPAWPTAAEDWPPPAELVEEAERRILEDALLGRLAQQIHDRTIDARDLIGRMSTEMRTRRMSSGVTVGVHWELADNLDEGQRDVCRLLDRDASRLGPEDLAHMRAHFASKIKTARAQHQDKSYADLLADVLDYRRWRTFAFTLVGGDGSEERLTQARHSTLSGGEQSVSLHLPLFAAAHVTLFSAYPHCPRLLALDEAFAGVDDTGRRELLGLTAQFDLDLFMTGYDLWATYDTVPACAHYDLSHSAVEHTVSALLLVWDGKEILADGTDDLAAALGSPGTRRRPISDGQQALSAEDDE